MRITQRRTAVRLYRAVFKYAVVSAADNFIDSQALDIPKYNRRNQFWQSNYHDHIIRDEKEYHRIAQYIIENPRKWGQNKCQK
ncbi:hypothetical protein [Ancylomarina sp.]|uniref:hypothetical protein n=1 Tax=Ancylomarina sp. TaxID=1970196 RepID=UPI003565F4EB